jgi:hypothetical protein
MQKIASVLTDTSADRCGRRSAAPLNCLEATQGSQGLALGLTLTAASQLARIAELENRVKLAIFAILHALGLMLSDVRIAQIATLTQF